MSEPPFLRNSERSTFKRCPQKWWWAYREGLRGRYEPAGHLWFGTGWHEALAQWYKPGMKRGTPIPRYLAKWMGTEKEIAMRTAVSDDPAEDAFVDAIELGQAMALGYVDKFKRDPTWEVVATEQPFQIEIPDPRKPHRTLVILAGTFDGVFVDTRTGETWLMEHKTAKSISVSHLPMDDQAGTYWMVSRFVLRDKGILGPKEEIGGIMYNFARKAIPDNRPQDKYGRFLNKDGSISANQPKPFFHREPVERGVAEQATQLERVQTEALLMQRIRNGKQREWKNITWTCAWECPFFDMCQLHEKGGKEWEYYRDAMFTVEDPYADHRKSAAE